VPLGGVLPRAEQRRLAQGTDLPMPIESQLYEITLEPATGSPTGRPTGPILYKGLATIIH
jgi:anti-sigma-K factor RskA